MTAILAILFALGIGGGVLITALHTRLGRQRCQICGGRCRVVS